MQENSTSSARVAGKAVRSTTWSSCSCSPDGPTSELHEPELQVVERTPLPPVADAGELHLLGQSRGAAEALQGRRPRGVVVRVGVGGGARDEGAPVRRPRRPHSYLKVLRAPVSKV